MATIYKVKTVPRVKFGETADETRVAVRWAGSEGAARKAKKALAEEHGLRPLKDVTYEAVDVPTSKAGLIEWLNENFAAE
jgi:hypothetical protein